MQSTQRDALQRTIACRLDTCSHDELRVLDKIISRLAIGREDYGPLDLARDARDFSQEAADELNDCLFYLAARAVAEEDRKRERLHREVEDELAAALPIAKAPDPARASEVLAALRDFRDSARPLYFDDETQIVDMEITAEIEKCR